ncbi:PEP-CTERM sorting domain-containing protein [Planctomycetota bacterium]
MHRAGVVRVVVASLVALCVARGARAVPLPFTDDLRLWLKADAGITMDGSNRVSQWNDQLIGDNTVAQNATQGTNGNKPIWTAGALGGLPVLRFDASDQLLGQGGLVLSGGTVARTVALVASSQNSNNTEIFDLARSGPATRPLYRITPEMAMRNGSGNRLWASNPLGTTAAVLAVQTPASPTSGTTIGYMNSTTALTPTATGSPTGAMDTGTDGYRTGAASFAGDIAEILVYERVLSAAELNKVGSYLAGKYGIAATFAGADIHWDNGSLDITSPVSPPYPGDNLWSTPSNWRADNGPQGVFPNDTLPGPTDRVNISLHDVAADPPAPCNVEAGDDLLVNSVRVGGNFGLGLGGHGDLNINGGTLTIADNGGVGTGGRLDIGNAGNSRVGTVNVAGGTLNVGENVALSGNSSLLNITDGALNVAGNITGGQGIVRVDGGAANVSGTTIAVNAFQVGWAAGSNGTFTLQAGQTLTTTDERVLLGEAGIGAFIQQAGSTVNVGTANPENVVVGGNVASGQGTYTMLGGSLSVSADLNVGNVTTATSTFDQQDGDVDVEDIQLAAGGAGSGHGTYLLKNGTLDTTGDLRIGQTTNGVGIFTQSGGIATIGDNVEMANGGGSTATLTLRGGTMNVAGNITDGAGTSKIVVKGGTLNMVNDGAITVDQMDIGNGTNGSLALDSDLTVKGLWRIGVSSQGTMTQTGGLITHTANDFNVGQSGGGSAGTYHMQGGTLNPSGNYFRVGASAQGTFNHSAGTVDVDASNFLIAGNNVGVYNLSGAGILNRTLDEVLGNNTQAKGTMNQSGGTHHITRDLKIANNASANNFGKYFMTGGSLDVDRHLRNGAVNGATGTFAVLGIGPTLINIDGNFTQNATSELLIGLEAASPHVTKIEVGGVADLEGLLEVSLLGGFQPNYGDTFDVLTAAGGVTADGLEVVGHPFFYHSIVDNGTTLQITYVPEPTTLSLLALGGLALLRRRRRR